MINCIFSVLCLLGAVLTKGGTDRPDFSSEVTAIDWTVFDREQPDDERSLLERDILLNANRYGLTTWYTDYKKYSDPDSGYVEVGRDVREVASQGFALAVSIKTGIYNELKTGVPLKKARKIALQLLCSVSRHHIANEREDGSDATGWGDSWQSALAAAYGGLGAWIMWQDLPEVDREYVRNMVLFEANRFNEYEPPYYKDAHGKVVFKGDTKSEENSWNATILHVAMAMMPHHENWTVWMDRNIELMLSANARPEDVKSPLMVNGTRLDQLLDGSNLNSDGTVTNHGIIHPDYMTCTSHMFFNALTFTLAQLPTPEAAFFNTDLIYGAIVDLHFPDSSYAPPGGTMYVRDSPAIYYPQNTDWGTGRRMCFALMDCQVDAFGLDGLASIKAARWELLHARKVLEMQERSRDGRTYLSKEEDSFGGREEWVAAHAAQAYLTKWLARQRAFSVTNKSY